MLGYRIYFLDDDNHIKGVVELAVETDEAAIEAAQQYRDGRDLELWTGARYVAKIPKLSHEES